MSAQTYGPPGTALETEAWSAFVADWLTKHGPNVPVATPKLLELASTRSLRFTYGARTLGRLLAARGNLPHPSGYVIRRRSWPVTNIRTAGRTYHPPTWALVNPPVIQRLRGSAPDLIWPPAMDELIERIRVLRDNSGAIRPQLWSHNLDEAQQGAAKLFATAQGWHVAARFPYERLLRKQSEDGFIPKWAPMEVFDHPVFFRQAGGDVALVIQPYRDISPSELPGDITVDRLPGSWHYPAEGSGTVGYVIRPRTSTRRLPPFISKRLHPEGIN